MTRAPVPKIGYHRVARQVEAWCMAAHVSVALLVAVGTQIPFGVLVSTAVLTVTANYWRRWELRRVGEWATTMHDQYPAEFMEALATVTAEARRDARQRHS